MKAIVSVVLTMFGLTAAGEGEPSWGLICHDGELRAADATIEHRVAGLYLIQVPGVLGCGAPEPGPKYAVSTYEPTTAFASINPSSVRDVATPAGPTTFTVVKHVFPGTGLCLVPNRATRLSCVKFVRTGTAVAVVSASEDDPFFRRKIVWDENPAAGPECPSCW